MNGKEDRSDGVVKHLARRAGGVIVPLDCQRDVLDGSSRVIGHRHNGNLPPRHRLRGDLNRNGESWNNGRLSYKEKKDGGAHKNRTADERPPPPPASGLGCWPGDEERGLL